MEEQTVELPTKFCKNCQHFLMLPRGKSLTRIECWEPSNVTVDPVHGVRHTNIPPLKMRDSGPCGVDAKFFMPRPQKLGFWQRFCGSSKE